MKKLLGVIAVIGIIGLAGCTAEEPFVGNFNVTGLTGLRGAVGPTGPQGPAGANGTNGTNGANGTSGNWGTIGGIIVDQTDLQNQLVAINASILAVPVHTHNNSAVLNATQESFTTLLKNSYDQQVSTFTLVWKQTTDDGIGNSTAHIADTSLHVPNMTGNAGKVLTTNGTIAIWAANSTAGGNITGNFTVSGNQSIGDSLWVTNAITFNGTNLASALSLKVNTSNVTRNWNGNAGYIPETKTDGFIDSRFILPPFQYTRDITIFDDWLVVWTGSMGSNTTGIVNVIGDGNTTDNIAVIVAGNSTRSGDYLMVKPKYSGYDITCVATNNLSLSYYLYLTTSTNYTMNDPSDWIVFIQTEELVWREIARSTPVVGTATAGNITGSFTISENLTVTSNGSFGKDVWMRNLILTGRNMTSPSLNTTRNTVATSGNLTVMGGNVGIGTTSPLYPLHMILTNNTTGADILGLNILNTVNSSASLTNKAVALYGATSIPATSAVNYTDIRGLSFAATFAGTGTANDTFGIKTFAENSGTGNVTRATAGGFQLTHTGAGTTATGIGVRIYDPYKTAGTITNLYGLYVEEQTKGTNNYAAIFAGGKVGIGTLTPIADLQIGTTGSATNNTLLYLSSGATATKNATIQMGTVTRDWNVQANGSPYEFHFDYIGTDAPLSNILVLMKNGRVGIGTNSPSALFSVNNLFTVNASGNVTITGNLTVSGSTNFTGNITVGGLYLASLNSSGVIPVTLLGGTGNTSLYYNGAGQFVALTGITSSWTPAVMTVNYGTLSSGNVSDLAAIGGTNVIITEVATANALQASINFTGVNGTPSRLQLHIGYNGSASHDVAIEIYNYTTGLWEHYNDIPTDTVLHWYTLDIVNGSDYVASNITQVRVRHEQSGTPGHILTIDYINLQQTLMGSGGGSISHSSLTGNNHSADHPWAFLAANVTTVATPNMTPQADENGTVDTWVSRIVEIALIAPNATLAVGNNTYAWPCPSEFNGWSIVNVHAYVITASSSGLPTFNIYLTDNSTYLLSTNCTIDINEKTSYTALNQPVINQTYKTLVTGQEIRYDCLVAGTGTKGWGMRITLRKP